MVILVFWRSGLLLAPGVDLATAIFGEEGDASLLGATTLEALGLALDSLRRELRPIPMML